MIKCLKFIRYWMLVSTDILYYSANLFFPRYFRISQHIRIYHSTTILIIGCGSGALFPFYLEAANQENIRLEITGLDLSPKMIEKARIHSETILDDIGGQHAFQFASGDFVQLVMGEVRLCIHSFLVDHYMYRV